MNNKVLLTTAIPYVNARPHIGHAQEFIIADALARLHRQAGAEVHFQSGSDDNASKNVLAAAKTGQSVQSFVDQNAKVFADLLTQLNVSTNAFVRTSSPAHHRAVATFWNRLDPKDLGWREYEALYCVGCEDFLLGKDLQNGLCPDHLTEPRPVSERNIFFRLSRYQEQLETLIESELIRVFPQQRKNEVLSFIRSGLRDISITRHRDRAAGWGIPVPGQPDQVVYVWIDALINYLTGQGFGSGETWRETWCESTKKIHVIGKNVWKFHAVYWPALLLSANLPLPNEIYVHGFLTADGQKISKSLGNSVDPIEVINRFGADALRHYLLVRTSTVADADFSVGALGQSYDRDLRHRLGNLFSRLIALFQRANIEGLGSEPPRVIEIAVDDWRNRAENAWADVDRLNSEINDARPWEGLRETVMDPQLLSRLRGWGLRLDHIATTLAPFIPEASARIHRGLRKPIDCDRILFAEVKAEVTPERAD